MNEEELKYTQEGDLRCYTFFGKNYYFKLDIFGDWVLDSVTPKEILCILDDERKKGKLQAEAELSNPVVYELGIEKGKLEQKKEELEFLESMQISQFRAGSSLYELIKEKIKQLSKEIGGEIE